MKLVKERLAQFSLKKSADFRRMLMLVKINEISKQTSIDLYFTNSIHDGHLHTNNLSAI